MPYFPVHDYGTSNMARWIMPAMQQKAALNREEAEKIAAQKETDKQRKIDVTWKAVDFLTKSKGMNPQAAKMGWDMVKSAFQEANIKINVSQFKSAAENKQAIDTGLENRMSEIWSKIQGSQPGDPNIRQLTSELGKIAGQWYNRKGEMHPIYAPVLKKLQDQQVAALKKKQGELGQGQFTLSPGQTRFGAGGKQIARVPPKIGGEGKPTDFENIYQELKKTPGKEKLTRFDVKKALEKKNINQAAVSLAQKDIRYMTGQKTLGEATREILDVLKSLESETTTKPKPARKTATAFLKANGMPITEANIKHFMENY